MSHGIPRASKPHVRSQEAYDKEQLKIEAYKKLDADIKSLAVSKSYTQHTLDLTSRLLKDNPEYATRWNDRRRILRAFFDDPGDIVLYDRIRAELDFLVPLLVKFPKCYAIWNHRIWLLQQASQRLGQDQAETVWQEELGLVGKMHTRDPRNFHGWNYRRFVVHELDKMIGRSPPAGEALCETEFVYTTTLIKRNLSNFSAWHNRSVIIPEVLAHRSADDAARRAMFNSELAFIKDALFLDPYDQSLWYYHEYLMSVLLVPQDEAWVRFVNQDREELLRIEITEIRELLDDDTCIDCKWIYQYLLKHTGDYMNLEAGNRLVSTQDLRAWFAALRRLDPMRSGRWNDWESKLDLN